MKKIAVDQCWLQVGRTIAQSNYPATCHRDSGRQKDCIELIGTGMIRNQAKKLISQAQVSLGLLLWQSGARNGSQSAGVDMIHFLERYHMPYSMSINFSTISGQSI